MKIALAWLAMMAGIFTLHSYSEAAILTTGTGPGGIGLTDGSSTLEMWYKADALGLSDGNAVATWTDSSGNGRSATGSGGQQPTFKTTGIVGFNGRPVVRFNGSTNELPIGSYTFTGNESTFFIHAPNENGTGGRGLLSSESDQRGWGIDAHVVGEADRYWVSEGIGPGTHTFSRQWGINGNAVNSLGSIGPLVGYSSGVAPAQIAYGQTNPMSGARSLDLGGNFGSAGVYDGDYAEAIVFSNTVNSAQRSIIENHLSSKYEISIVGDRYSGDSPGNGNYDYDVFGIGRVDLSNQQLSGGSQGFGFETTSLDDDEWLLAGHNNIVSTTALKWDRAWYLQPTNLDGDELLDLAFDWSDAGVASFDATFTRLLFSSISSGPFTSVAIGTYSGDRLSFMGIASASFPVGYYTIGIPEPSALVIAMVGACAALFVHRRRASGGSQFTSLQS